MSERQHNRNMFRQHITSSSPELRALESQLHQCYVNAENKAAIVEKALKEKKAEITEKKIMEFSENLAMEENVSNNLHQIDKQLKAKQNRRDLDEQVAEKALRKAEAEAENVVESLAAKDEIKILEREKEEQFIKKKENRITNLEFLKKQKAMKELLKEEEILQASNVSKAAEEYSLKREIQKELLKQEREMTLLQKNQQQHSMMTQLDNYQRERERLSSLRLEMSILEKAAEEKELYRNKEEKVEAEKKGLRQSWDAQLELKKSFKENERIMEERYKKIILDVMAEEGHLDQLTQAAKRRRQQHHNDLAEVIVQDRRKMRDLLMKQKHEKDQHLQQYHKLKDSIVAEEEKKLLLTHAPHLMQYFTPQILERITKLVPL